MVLGVVGFTLSGGNKKGGNDDWALTPSFLLGLFLVFAALACDGIYGPYQSKIKAEYSAKNYHNMWNMGLWEFIMAAALCVFTGELQGALNFIQRHPEVMTSKLVKLFRYFFAFLAM